MNPSARSHRLRVLWLVGVLASCLLGCSNAEAGDLELDLDAVRRALGVETINLWGASYGSRAALVYLRQYGKHVRTATLLGVAPPSQLLPLDLPRDAQAALDATLAACAADPRCAARHGLSEFATRFGLSLLSRFHLGMTLSVICSEDVPVQSPELIRREAEGTFLGPEMGLHVLEACSAWPRGEIPADYHEPVRSDVPVLLLSGAVDPVTPPRHAAEAVKHLSAGRHLVVPESGHFGNQGCSGDLVSQFVEAGTAEGLDASCLEAVRRPPFEGS